MNEEERNTLESLATVSQIEQGDQIYTERNQIYIGSYRYMSGVVRWFWGEGRHQNIKMVDKVFRCAYDIINRCIGVEQRFLLTNKENAHIINENERMRNMQLLFRVEHKIKGALVGVGHLMNTYKDDASVVSKITTIQEEAADELQRIAFAVGRLCQSAQETNPQWADYLQKNFEIVSQPQPSSVHMDFIAAKKKPLVTTVPRARTNSFDPFAAEMDSNCNLDDDSDDIQSTY